jgi:hypothetical protein
MTAGPALGGRYASWRGGHLVGLDIDDRIALGDAIDRCLQPPQHLARLLRQLERRLMTFAGIAYLPASAESPGAICESPSCTTDATSAPSHVNTLPRAIARPPALDATCCE